MRFMKPKSNMGWRNNNGNEMVLISLCRKHIVRLSLCTIFIIGATTVFTVQYTMLTEKVEPQQSLRYETDLKYILLWKPDSSIRNGSKRRYPKLPEGQKVFINQKCEYVNCFITYDRHLLKDDQNMDAIVFNVRDIINMKPREFKLRRSPKQMYVFRSLDSSHLYPVCNNTFENFFNWTWTYKLYSDIPHPFFNIYDSEHRLVGPKVHVNWTRRMEHSGRYGNITKGKNKAIAWITNCKLKVKYQEFIAELKEEMRGYNATLDTFGPCGSKKCPEGSILKCHNMIEKHYYFQLVLENSLAVDYVTEKVGMAMNFSTIPILLGMSKYNRFLPPGSYINAQAFDMKKLGAIVNYLMRNPKYYQSFFDWKNHYYYTLKPKREMCGLCKKLNEYTNATRRPYNQFRKWWHYNYKDTCRNIQIENPFL